MKELFAMFVAFWVILLLCALLYGIFAAVPTITPTSWIILFA